jgi:hypothetical protein
MKSIREWRADREGRIGKNLMELNLATSLRNFVGGANIKQDPRIKAGLRSKILGLWKDAQGSGMSALDFVRQVWAIAGSLATGKSGTNLSVGTAAKGLNAVDDHHQEWAELSELVLKEMVGDADIDKSQFAKFAGSTTLDVDSKLKQELRSKINHIGEMKEFSGLTKAELFKKIVAAVAALEADVSGSTISIASVAGKMNSADDDKDIAQEVR